MRKAIYPAFLFLIISCSNSTVPNGIIQPDKMEAVAYDLLKADEYISNISSKDTTTNIKLKRSILYEQVFKLHDTSRKDFYTSYRYYQQHPDIQKTLFDSLAARAGRGRNEPPRIFPVKALKAK